MAPVDDFGHSSGLIARCSGCGGMVAHEYLEIVVCPKENALRSRGQRLPTQAFSLCYGCRTD